MSNKPTHDSSNTPMAASAAPPRPITSRSSSATTPPPRPPAGWPSHEAPPVARCASTTSATRNEAPETMEIARGQRPRSTSTSPSAATESTAPT